MFFDFVFDLFEEEVKFLVEFEQRVVTGYLSG